jgi:hypothetical protein
MTSSTMHGMNYIKFTILPLQFEQNSTLIKSQFDVCLEDALEQALKWQSLCKNVPITMSVCVALLKA